MSPFEVEALMEEHYNMFKNGWERTRMTNHAIISSNASKPVKVTDVMQFPWDKDDNKVEKSREINQETFDRFKKKFNLA